MKQVAEVIVVGGGVVGLTAALMMRQRGYTVALLDSALIQSHPNQRVYALNYASQKLFTTLKVWSLIDAEAITAYQHMHVWDAISKAYIDFDARMIGNDRLGVIVDESALKTVLLQQALAQGVIFCDQYCVQSVKLSANSVTLSNQQDEWCGSLLIVADGANSRIRDYLGVTVTQWSYQQVAITAVIRTEKSHQYTCWQRFNPDGPIAFLPLADPHQASIVWSTSIHRAEKLMQLDDNAFVATLAQAFENKLGKMSLIGPRKSFPLKMRHAKQYSGSNWLLMGDAAHTIHPLAGLGLNLGLADVSTWLSMQNSQPKNLSNNKMLGAYQRQRKAAVWQSIMLMEVLKRLFASSFLPVTILRGMGLSVCNRSTILKRLMIEHAVGVE